MIKQLYLTFTALLLASSLWAQSNYKPGYVVNAAGDTLRGHIDYREWDLLPRYIEFKADAAVGAIRFYPHQLRSFAVNGVEQYQSYIGVISMDKTSFPDLPYALDTAQRRDSIFLRRVYTASPLSLLVHNDRLKTRYFVQDGNSEPIELPFHQYYTNENLVRNVDTYRNTLLTLAQKHGMGSSEKVFNAVQHMQFREGDIRRVLKLINNDESTSAKSPRAGSRFFMGILFNRTTTQFDGQTRLSGYPTQSYMPRLNAGIDLFVNKSTQRLTFRIEVSVWAIKPRITNGLSDDLYSSRNAYQFNQYTAAIAPQLKYNVYNTDNFRAFLGAGFAINFSRYSNNHFTGRYSSESEYFQLEKVWSNFPVQAGVTLYNKLEIYALYEHPEAYTRYPFFSVSNTTYGLGVHYLFK